MLIHLYGPADFSDQGPFSFKINDYKKEFEFGMTAKIFDWNRTQGDQAVGELMLQGQDLIDMASKWTGDPVVIKVRDQLSLSGG